MRKDTLILLIKIASYILLYIPLILILLTLFDIVYIALNYGIGNAFHAFTNSLFPLFVYLALILVGDWLRSLSNNMKREIETQLIGYLLSAQSPLHVGKISQILEISEKAAINTFLKVKSEGKLREFIFDNDRGEIIPPAYQPGSLTAMTQEITSTSITGELLLKAKLKELERLKSEGKISEKAYEELRKEILEGKY